MKVYLVYNGKDAAGTPVRDMAAEFKVKIDVPSSWMNLPCEKLLQFFIKTYNAKNTDTPLEADEVEMKVGGITLKGKETIADSVHEYNDILFMHKVAVKPEEAHEGETLCTNYGCGKYYKEEDNTDTSCLCHTKPPVFHDLEKYWACCPGHKAFDWEGFQAIEKCHTGRHSTTNKPFTIPKEDMANTPLTLDQISAQLLQRSAPLSEERRTTGPREFEGAMPMEPQQIVDGKAKCRNFGCGREFVVEENSDAACTFHAGGPIFHEGRKYWACCPSKKCDDFSDFMAVPGCTIGPHKL